MKAQPIIFPPSPDITAKLAVLAADSPVSYHARGNLDLLTRPTLALFCSAKAPIGVILQIHDLAQRWRVARPIIISGLHSPAEQEALVVLLRGPQPGQNALETRVPRAERRLLMSPFGERVRR